jgi:hypothetical protein
MNEEAEKMGMCARKRERVVCWGERLVGVGSGCKEMALSPCQ